MTQELKLKLFNRLDKGDKVRLLTREEGNLFGNYNIAGLEVGMTGTIIDFSTEMSAINITGHKRNPERIPGMVYRQIAIINWDTDKVLKNNTYAYLDFMIGPAEVPAAIVDDPVVTTTANPIDDPDFIFRPRSTKTFYRGF